MLHVYEIPEKRSDGYCFAGGRPIVFQNVDWMNEPGEVPEHGDISDEDLISFIQSKNYYRPNKTYLLLMSQRALIIPGES